jgi:hypothetical protein
VKEAAMRTAQRGLPTQRTSVGRLAAVLIIAAALSGCGGSVALPSQDSGIEGVRVPLSAQLDESEPGFRVYLIPNMSFAEVTAWYDEVMPPYKDFGDWQWCVIEATESSSDRAYRRGEVGVLLVRIRDSRLGVELGVVTAPTASQWC